MRRREHSHWQEHCRRPSRFPRWVTRLLGMGLGMTVVGAAALHGCTSRSIAACGVLPDADACPAGRGGTCDDETCSALYDCVAGEWVLTMECGAGGDGGDASSGQGAGGQGGCNGVDIDRTGASSGSCSPPLQEPDCPAAVAELCRPCETLCVDFFLCQDDGWQAVAFCDAEGNVIVQP